MSEAYEKMTVLALRRVAKEMGVKLGAAKAASTATMATTTMVSMRVKPRCTCCAGVKVDAGMKPCYPAKTWGATIAG